MSTELQISQELDIIKSLPDSLQRNSNLFSKADAKTKEVIAAFNQIDIVNCSVQVLNDHEAILSDNIVRLREAKEICEKRRKPGTQILDAYKTKFTTIENGLGDISDKLKGKQSLIQKEKLRRQAEDELRKKNQTAKINEAVSIAAKVAIMLNDAIGVKIAEARAKMDKQLAETTLESIATYEAKVNSYIPNYNHDLFTKLWAPIDVFVQYHSGEEKVFLIKKTADEKEREIKDMYENSMLEYKDTIKDLIPGRIQQLEGIAKAASEQEKKELQEKAEAEMKEAQQKSSQELSQKQAQRNETVQQHAETTKANTLFDNVDAKEAINTAKGTRVKKKYKITSITGWNAIIQMWVSRDMRNFSMEELEKKFSFAKTFAEKVLNESGEEISMNGLVVEDDVTVTTRGTKKK